MSLIKAVKYRLWENKRALIIFYGIMYAVITAANLAASAAEGNVNMGGFELASMIFIFIVGLTFAETFKMLLQNGCSRKTIFLSFVYSTIAIAALMALIDGINSLLIGLLTNYKSMFLQLYGARFTETAGKGIQFFEGLLWSLTAYAMVAMAGLFITSAYYRMNKQLKLLVSIGVPVTIFIILPTIDNLTDVAIYGGIARFFTFAWGFQNGSNPYFSMATCTLLFALLGGLAYLLIRNAVVREKP